MFRSLRAMLRDPEGKVLAASAIVLILVGTVAYVWMEGWSPIDALYFSVVTLATVGFGDLHPTTDASKLFTVFYILSGLGVIAAFLSELPKYRRPRDGSESRHEREVESRHDQEVTALG